MQKTDQRQAVFTRIREALRRPAPHRHADHAAKGTAKTAAPVSDAEAFRAWLPPVGPTLDDQIELFAQNAAGLKADFRAVASAAEASQQLAALAVENNWKEIASHHAPLPFGFAEKLGLPCLLTDSGYSPATLEQCDAAITGCDALVAQTGSILVTPQSAGGRTLSVLPPHHVVVARRKPDGARSCFRASGRPQALRAELAELSLVHHRPQPHRRHRAHPRSRRARPEETDDLPAAVDRSRRQKALPLRSKPRILIGRSLPLLRG